MLKSKKTRPKEGLISDGEPSTFSISEDHGKFAIVAICTKLMVLEYFSSREYKLLERHVPLHQREILDVLNARDREILHTTLLESNARLNRLARPATEAEAYYDRIYDRALYGWRAIAMTVLNCTLLKEEIVWFDEDLVSSVISFKKWYFRSCFSHHIIDTDGRVIWPGVDNTITLLKRLSAWITYYGAFSTETHRPRDIDAMPGSSPGRQTLTWFGGGLSSLREPWLLPPTKVNVHTLATMSGFSRALPCASSEMALAAGKETFSVLTTSHTTDPSWVSLFSTAAYRVGKQMKHKLPTVTHCSINSSACYEATQEQGGTASVVVAGVNKLLSRRIDLDLIELDELPEALYDPFGRAAVAELACDLVRLRKEAILSGKTVRIMDMPIPAFGGISRPMPFGFVAYRKGQRADEGRTRFSWNLGHSQYGSYRVNLDYEDTYGSQDAVSYNETLGSSVAVWAFSEALQYGHFVDHKRNRVEPVIPGLALFREKGVKLFVQDKPVPAKFMVLEEPGWKSRALTKNKAFVVILQALLRHALADVLSADGRCGFGLKSSYILWDFLKFLKKQRTNSKWYYVSTDLSSATDLIPHDVLNAMWSGFLAGMGFTHDHPLWSLANMIMVNHTLEWNVKKGINLVGDHLRGSFMGEPVSFMGLTLYNLCVGEVAGFIRLQAYSLFRSSSEIIWNSKLRRKFLLSGPNPTGFVVITGDDRTEVTDLSDMFPIINYVYKSTGAKPSIGKNTVSHYHGIHAENHLFNDGGTHVYLDIVKSKLLTPSTRFHSDNQSSILGKGSSLFLQLEWLKEAKFFDSAFISRHVNHLYIDMVRKGFPFSVIRRAGQLPIEFPPCVGGIRFPGDFKEVCARHRDVYGYVKWLLTIPVEEFLQETIRLRAISSGVKRGLPSDFTSPMWQRILTFGRDHKFVVSDKFDPNERESLHTMRSVLDYARDHMPEIPVSPNTGFPQVNLTLREIYQRFGFLPLESFLDLLERQTTFFKAFVEGPKPLEKLSFQKYLGRLSRFYREALVRVSSIPLHEIDLDLKSMDDIHWRFQQRLKTVIHIDCVAKGALHLGPSLHLDLTSSGRARSYLGEQNMLDHTIGAYLRRLADDDEHVIIFRDEWASAQPVVNKR